MQPWEQNLSQSKDPKHICTEGSERESMPLSQGHPQNPNQEKVLDDEIPEVPRGEEGVGGWAGFSRHLSLPGRPMPVPLQTLPPCPGSQASMTGSKSMWINCPHGLADVLPHKVYINSHSKETAMRDFHSTTEFITKVTARCDPVD